VGKKVIYPPADPKTLCQCECHKPGVAITHFAPCCYTCPDCGANIDDTYIEDHRNTCKPKKNRHKK
jgi:hypothetical protein